MTRKGEFCRMTAYDIIELKKRGKILSEEQIRAFVRMVTDESASDAQIAAFCMAVLWRGMTDEECFVLTDAMAKSGVCAEKPNVSGVYADKHSTGGVSDSTTLILVPVLASLGVKCAKYSGRGLGHTGGTLDKMESFPNLRVTLSAEEFEKQVDKVGAAIAGQTSATVPADKRMYAVRDVTATVDSIPLIASSVMSKKLASFADVILLDVKYGDGAFMRRPSDAVKLAELMVRIGTAAGRKIGAAVTCMDVPLGDNIGCNAEVREAIEVLKGKKNALSELSLYHCRKILQMSEGLSQEQADQKVKRALESGSALEKLKQIVSAQGGDVRAVDDFSLLPLAPHRLLVCAPRAGKLHVSALALGKACSQLGGGRAKEGDPIDHTVGILLKRRAGDRVEKGEPIAEIFYRKENKDAILLAESAFTVKDSYRARPLVYSFIGKEKL